MAISSLISGLFGTVETGLNYSSQIDTNKSNERNVNATNQANLAMTEATNATNLKITQETNASNERIMQETNAFNAAQADLAYQRSTSAAKLGELISAGLSPEQARQVIASQGITGSPTNATGTAIPAQGATMQAPQFQPFQKQAPQLSGLPEIGKNLGDFAQSIVEAAKDPAGGTLGQLSCMKQFAKASDIIDEVDSKSLSSPYEFFKWMKSQPADSNWGKLISTKDFQYMWNNPISRKAFMYNMKDWYGQSASIAFNLEQAEANIRLTNAQKHSADIEARLSNANIFKTISETDLIGEQINLTSEQANLFSEQVEGQKISNTREQILLDRDKELKDLITETQKAQFAAELANAQLQEQLLTDPDYRNAYFTSTIGNLAAATAEYEFVKWRYNTTLKGKQIIDPDTFAVFTLLEDLGFAGTQTYEDMLKAVAKDSNLTLYLMGKGFRPVKNGTPVGPIDGYSYYKSSLEQWSRDMEKIRYDAMKPFFKREDIKFGIDKSVVDVPGKVPFKYIDTELSKDIYHLTDYDNNKRRK